MTKKGRKPDPVALVRRLTREELEALVLDRLAGEDKALANAIITRFANSDVGGAKALVRSLVENSIGNQYGIIDDAWGLSCELEELRKRARGMKSPSKHIAAFALLMAIVEEVAPDCWEVDDHEGVLIGAVQTTLDDIRTFAVRPDTDPACLAEIGAWARDNVNARWAVAGDSWDFELILIQLAASRGGEERRRALQVCQAKCMPKGDEWHSSYLAEKCAGVILEALESSADEVERRTFIAGNMHLDVVRKEAISLALKEEDFETAMRFAREGMDLAEKGKNAGTADEYADRLVETLEARGDASAALAFLEARIIEKQSMDWLGKLKARIPDQKKWGVLRERILVSLPSGTRHFTAEILASENLIERLRELTKADASLIRTHYKQIGQSFPEDAAHYLEQGIRKELKRTHSRGGYQRIAETVREFGGYAGKPAMVKLVDALVSSYSNRPAMIAELRKAVGMAKARS